MHAANLTPEVASYEDTLLHFNAVVQEKLLVAIQSRNSRVGIAYHHALVGALGFCLRSADQIGASIVRMRHGDIAVDWTMRWFILMLMWSFLSFPLIAAAVMCISQWTVGRGVLCSIVASTLSAMLGAVILLTATLPNAVNSLPGQLVGFSVLILLKLCVCVKLYSPRKFSNAPRHNVVGGFEDCLQLAADELTRDTGCSFQISSEPCALDAFELSI